MHTIKINEVYFMLRLLKLVNRNEECMINFLVMFVCNK